MSRTVLAAAILISASVTLAGCSASPSSTTGSSSAAQASSSTAASASAPASASASASSSSSVEAADGVTIKGTGYTYVVPKGWKVPTGAAATSGPDSLAADLTDTDGFSDNVNVIVLKNGAVTADQAESQGPAGLKQVGATKVSVRDRVAVAGEETAHLSALTSTSGTKYRVDQYYLGHDGETYVVTFSSSPGVSQAERDEVSESVLQTWDWT